MQITKEELDAILEAGIYAPTGMGKQSPIIVVIQDQETIMEISNFIYRAKQEFETEEGVVLFSASKT